MYTTPKIPPTSRVAFFPASGSSSSENEGGGGLTYVPGRVDVTVSKVIAYIKRVVVESEEVEDPGSDERDNGRVTEDDEEELDNSEDIPFHPSYPSNPSSARQRPHLSRTRDSSSPSPSPPGSPNPNPTFTRQRPRKRARWANTVDNGDPESLSIATMNSEKTEITGKTDTMERKTANKAKATQSDMQNMSTATKTPPLTKFETGLMAELTCEICFMLLCEPVTTPCQHVRCV